MIWICMQNSPRVKKASPSLSFLDSFKGTPFFFGKITQTETGLV